MGPLTVIDGFGQRCIVYTFLAISYVHRRKGMVELDEKEWPYKYIFRGGSGKYSKKWGEIILKKTWMKEWMAWFLYKYMQAEAGGA